MLGQDVRVAARDGGHDVVAMARGELDITDPEAVDAAVAEAMPEVVINCAAWTNVDGAEAEEPAATAVNGAGAGNVARAAAARDAWTVHVSSDYVFDGRAREPYVESSPTAPLSAYGRSKLAGEREVSAAASSSHTIVRSSWLFGVGGRCFPATIRRLAGERDELTVVDDQVGCPTFTGHLAVALLELAVTRPLGVVHVAGGGRCSWYEFAREIVSASGLACAVRPIRTEDLGLPAPRPAFSVLGSEREGEVPKLPDWRQGLSDYLAVGVSST
jgi:dTDP-4-dehydrorhamnose reductase